MTLQVRLGEEPDRPIISGDRLTFEGVIYSDTDLTTPRDLTGVSEVVLAILDPAGPDNTPKATISLTGGEIAILSPAIGLVRYTLAEGKTKDFSGTYPLQSVITDSGGARSTSITGSIRLSQGWLD